MAKELPFFKFEPAIYETGSIQMCSFEAQGVFINICSMYWQRLGDLPYKLALQKVCKGNAMALDSLIEEGVINNIDGMICIDFLNEQLSEFENTSKVNSENARSGWEKRRKNATSMPPQSDPNAIRGEERREDEREKKIIQEVSAIIKYSSPNTSDLNYMVRQWIKEGQINIPQQLIAMKAYYAKQKIIFPTRIQTLTESFTTSDWIEKLKELEPEEQEKIKQNGKQHKPAIDIIGSSQPGSLE